jgi:stringent starvation protein B
MIPTSPGTAGTSTRPYLIRALHEWCTDNGLTPYVAVFVDASVQVPVEFVKNNEIVLNVAFEATTGMALGNEFIEFKARFGGTSRDIVVPVTHVIAIYARENGQGMAFPAPTEAGAAGAGAADAASTSSERPAGTGSERPATGGLRLASGGGPALAAAPEVAALSDDADEDAHSDGSDDSADTPEPTPPAGGRPALKRVK